VVDVLAREKLPNILGTTNLPSWWIIAVYCSLLLQLTSSDCIRLGGELTLQKNDPTFWGPPTSIIVDYCSSLLLIDPDCISSNYQQ
jgi:hypothetical protein